MVHNIPLDIFSAGSREAISKSNHAMFFICKGV